MKKQEKAMLLWSTGAVLSAVVFGAMGAHALKAVLSETSLLSFETAVKYQMYMGLALGVMVLIDRIILESSLSSWVYRMHVAGMLAFSGSIYVLVFVQSPLIKSIVGPITPIGGTLLIFAWAWIFIHIARSKVSI
ncbi:MAG: DUF423 domain-containing protein [Flavobacteriales bacterium]|nr:DUF423 domain-containing protein [Flavobacteriales bacterium]MDG1765260.1 DUF423 domain-containing protein [Flavobacteriales bacterium]